MKHLPMLCTLAVLAGSTLSANPAISADDTHQAGSFAPLAPGERDRLTAEAAEKRNRAQVMRGEAETGYRQSEAACYKKIMVNRCLDDAKRQRTQATVEARKLDLDANRIEREVRLRENAQHQADAAQKAPQRDEAAAEDASRKREEAATDAAAKATRDAERERELEQAPARAEAEAARRQHAADAAAKRQATEAKRARERADAATRQRAELDRKAAEHAKKQADAEAEAARKAAGVKAAP